MSYSEQIPNIQAMMLDKLDKLEEMVRTIKDANQDKNGMDQEQYLTVEKTSLFLDCSTPYVYTLKTRIPHVLRGARLYFKKSDLIEYMDRGRVIPNPVRRSARYKSNT